MSQPLAWARWSDIPGSIRKAVIISGLFVLLNVLLSPNTGMLIARVAVGLLILFGFVKRHRLAWQWGRLLPVLMLIGAFMNINQPLDAWIDFMVFSALAVALTIALTRPGSITYFRLICPACQRKSKKADDLLFRRARCIKCRNVW